MNDVLELKKQNACVAYEQGTDGDRQLLQRLFPNENFTRDITERVKTFADACMVLGKNTEDYDIMPDMDEDERAGIYFRKLVIIVRALRGDWMPDFSNSNEYKWYPYWKYVPGSGFALYGVVYGAAFSGVGARLVFPSEKLAEYAAKQFQQEYNDWLLNK